MMETGFRELDLLPGHSMVGNIAGRLYQNTTLGISMLNALGKDFVDMAKEMGGVRDEYLDTMDQYLVPLPEATLWTILPQGLVVRRKEKRALKGEKEWAAGNPAWCKAMQKQILLARAPGDLARLLEEKILPRSLDTFWRTYATALRYSEQVGPLRRQLTEMVGIQDADALLSGVGEEEQMLASLGPMVGLARVARGEMSREEYLARWGHRGTQEIEVMIPRPAEDPDWLDRQIEKYDPASTDVEAMLEVQAAAADAAWQRFVGRYPKKGKVVRRQLAKAASAARLRETARSESVRLLWVVRNWVLRSGAVTGLGDGAFFLTMDELVGLLSGREAPIGTIPTRRQTHERYRRLPPLPMLIRGRFDPFAWAEDSDRNPSVFDSHGRLPTLTIRAKEENVLLGMPGSAGQAEGIVRCLAEPEEGEVLESGDILVASLTNIGWTPLFPRVGAIVTDIGAPLSHAAIVARELGIPAVVNCGDATARLRNGDRVSVNGTQGTVTILERAG
jgi:pyruvate,water dikinase